MTSPESLDTTATDPDTDLPGLDQVVESTADLINTVSGLSDADVREPSVLPGWSRAHVITHLARNADALRNVLHGAEIGEVRAMYISAEERDAAIEVGAERSAGELLEDLSAACHRWDHAANEVHASHLDALGRRVDEDEGATFPVRRVGMLRLTEVEVHHADLGCRFTAEDFSPLLTAYLLERRRKELERGGVALRVSPSDGEGWATGEGGPEVSGSTADILWWLLGRGAGSGVTCSEGQLPDLGKWA
jgi:maleylpyruvate isomerase